MYFDKHHWAEFAVVTAFMFAAVGLIGYVIGPALGIQFSHGEYGYLMGSVLGISLFYLVRVTVRKLSKSSKSVGVAGRHVS